MAESGSDSDNSDWISYKDRPEWNDVTPLAQDDGPHPVVQIAYSEQCTNMDSDSVCLVGS